MREIIDVGAHCARCTAATRVTLLERTVSEDGEDVGAIWSEPLPPHDCERMQRLAREQWPASTW